MGAASYDSPRYLAADLVGNSVVGGIFANTITLANGQTLNGNETQDIFVIRYDPTGNVSWLKGNW